MSPGEGAPLVGYGPSPHHTRPLPVGGDSLSWGHGVLGRRPGPGTPLAAAEGGIRGPRAVAGQAAGVPPAGGRPRPCPGPRWGAPAMGDRTCMEMIHGL